MSEDYLSHYGVLGMKWGVRKKTESSGGVGLRSVEEKKKIGEAVNAEAFRKERAKAEKAAEKERKKTESNLKKAAKAAASAAKKAAFRGKERLLQGQRRLLPRSTPRTRPSELRPPLSEPVRSSRTRS